MHKRLTQIVTGLIISCLLGACGFQLRGSGATTVLPDSWKSMHLVTSNRYSELSREVITRFAANGVQWEERDAANYRVILKPEQFEQRNLALNSEARAAEFELTMSTRFTVLDAENNVAMVETDVAVIKQMENDPRNVVGKAEEVRLLKSEMRVELAQQIMRRIGFYAASTQTNP
ncbi:MAG: LPS-assembly lipoprotein [Halioglobus sp.]|jgi:LPS-assembly lipoprotein